VAHLLRSRWLPSDWDTRRLLRFLAGLALLGLAFTGPAATVPAPAAPSPAVIMAAPGEASVTLSEPVSAPSPVRVEAAPVPAEGPAALVVMAVITVLTGAALRVRGGRAPPAA
jgi:hypothetical protein